MGIVGVRVEEGVILRRLADSAATINEVEEPEDGDDGVISLRFLGRPPFDFLGGLAVRTWPLSLETEDIEAGISNVTFLGLDIGLFGATGPTDSLGAETGSIAATAAAIAAAAGLAKLTGKVSEVEAAPKPGTEFNNASEFVI